MSQRRARQQRTTLLWVIGAVAVLAIATAGLLLTRDDTPSLTAADLERVSPQEAYALVQNDEASLYDVRLAEAYQDLHAEGAISLPEPEAVMRLAELPPDRLLIFY